MEREIFNLVSRLSEKETTILLALALAGDDPEYVPSEMFHYPHDESINEATRNLSNHGFLNAYSFTYSHSAYVLSSLGKIVADSYFKRDVNFNKLAGQKNLLGSKTLLLNIHEMFKNLSP